ncbi:hypothetical protein LJR277_003778 [Pseudomonas sp. LjRoot277]|uniref:hypothetical protein n=1 Tax=Pseudomonas sp. LjRoot277 TaxID=3342307 RepID=UPI003ED0953C
MSSSTAGLEAHGMSFELLWIPEGFKTDLALVIAPYVESKFMVNLIKQMQPNRLCLLVDDGIRAEDLQRIRKDCGRGVKLEIRLARAAGLMHMKAFYFEFVREEAPKRRKRRLLFGSANATNSAFHGGRNAELIADVDLAIREDANVADYFSSILETFNNDTSAVVEAREVWLSKQPTLYLPRFKSIVIGTMPSGFDTWLQRGMLAAQFRNAPQFATLTIHLKQALPQDLIAKIFASRSFTEKGGRNIVRYGYMNGTDEITVNEEECEKPRWKSRYAVWTHLGDWISSECYKAHSKSMKSKAANSRDTKIKDLIKYSSDQIWRRERIDALLEALNQVWGDLKAAGVPPSKYLESIQGNLNSEFYEKRFTQKLDQDLQLANDEDFKKRYVNGYEFPDVPRFRQDTAAWESFVRSWCESIAVEAIKNRTLSLVARQIRKAMEYEGLALIDLEHTDISKYLRNNWETKWEDDEITVGDWIAGYYE